MDFGREVDQRLNMKIGFFRFIFECFGYWNEEL